MKKRGWVPIMVLAMGQIVFFMAMFDGFRNSHHQQPLNFNDISGLGFGLFLICLYLHLKFSMLAEQLNDLKKPLVDEEP